MFLRDLMCHGFTDIKHFAGDNTWCGLVVDVVIALYVDILHVVIGLRDICR